MIDLKIYGASHAPEIGMVLSGIPKGESIDLGLLQEYLNLRKASSAVFSTSRQEPDILNIKSGIANGVTTGEPIEAFIKNTSQKPNDYADLAFKPRPSHADYPAYIKYGLDYDISGGGKFSGRMTAPLVIAGGIAKQILNRKGIKFLSYVSEIGGIKGFSYKGFPPARLNSEMKVQPLSHEMLKEIESAKAEEDSLGGIVEVIVFGVPVGTGDFLFSGLESLIAYYVYGVPAVKGLEFGLGFDIAKLKGSEANDCYFYENGKADFVQVAVNNNGRISYQTVFSPKRVVQLAKNNNGGIVGGMANGAPISLSVAIKPTPSIGKEQPTVNLKTKENTTIKINGRHDTCIVPRALIAIESATAIAILSALN
ncbi:MAG: chorismate synthase [Firmicutes bacterium]|nr:chorismate synthase [Bacillota bacterium]